MHATLAFLLFSRNNVVELVDSKSEAGNMELETAVPQQEESDGCM